MIYHHRDGENISQGHAGHHYFAFFSSPLTSNAPVPYKRLDYYTIQYADLFIENFFNPWGHFWAIFNSMANPEGFTEASDDPTDGFRLSSFDEFRPDFTKWENSFYRKKKSTDTSTLKTLKSTPQNHLWWIKDLLIGHTPTFKTITGKKFHVHDQVSSDWLIVFKAHGYENTWAWDVWVTLYTRFALGLKRTSKFCELSTSVFLRYRFSLAVC